MSIRQAMRFLCLQVGNSEARFQTPYLLSSILKLCVVQRCMLLLVNLITHELIDYLFSQIEKRLQEVEVGLAPDLVAACWAKNHGKWCVGVNWDRTPLQDLLEICR